MNSATDKTGKESLPWILLGILVAVSGGLLLSLTAGIHFISDEWNLLFLRPGWSPNSFLEPFHEHIIIAPAFIYKMLQGTFGMESNRPFQIAAILTFLTLAPLLFIWMRRRVGEWAALIGVAVILFLGAAFEDLLWAFQIGYFGSLACGVGALLALDRDDRQGDLAAAVLLVLGLSFSSLGVPFIVGAGVEWLVNPRERRRRWLIPASGLIFYALWWLGWGHDAESAVSLSNLPEAPRYVFDAASAAVTSSLGLATGDGSEPDQPHLIWGRIGLVVLLGLAAWRLWRMKKVPPGVLVTGAIALAFFGLAALGQNELRPPTSSRYQLPAVLMLLLFFTEILRGVRLAPPALAAAGMVVLVTSLLGVDLMKEQAETRWRPASDWTRTYLGTVAYAGAEARPDLVLDLGPGSAVPVHRFLDEIEASGTPGLTGDQLEGADAGLRAQADQILVDATGPLLSGEKPASGFGGCVTHAANATATVDGSADTVEVRSLGSQDLAIGLNRFGDPPGISVGSVIAGSKAWLLLPRIDSPPDWKLTGDGRFAVCYRRSG